MKIELEKVIGASVIIGGIVFGYGQLSSKVENLQEYNDTEIRKLADDNMNDIIELKTKMNLLVTPQMTIVPSNKHASHELARAKLNSRLEKIEAWITHEEKKQEERRQNDKQD
jgi:hypothetical protein